MIRLLLPLALLVTGSLWGLGVPFTRIAVSGGHDPLGLTVWTLVFGIATLGPVMILRRARLPLDRAALVFYAVLGLAGTVAPGILTYTAARHLPAGVSVILIATVPMFTLLMAVLAGIDRAGFLRLAGVVAGLAAVALLAAPDALPDPGATPYLLLNLAAALLYAAEANWVALRAPVGLDPIATLFGASVVGLVLTLPVTLLLGRGVDLMRPWGAPDWAILYGGVLNAFAYAGYYWMIGKAGPVFAAQVSYVVTVSGVFWSILILHEHHSGHVWGALLLMLAGLALVQPRPGRAVSGAGPSGTA